MVIILNGIMGMPNAFCYFLKQTKALDKQSLPGTSEKLNKGISLLVGLQMPSAGEDQDCMWKAVLRYNVFI